MLLPDVNVLLCAVNVAAPMHVTARRALEAAYASVGGVGLTWIALLGFVRIGTRSGVFARPLTIEAALQVLRTWLSHPAATVLHPGDRHLEILGRLLLGAGTAGNLSTDAHLAAIAIEHGATLLSFDRDFERFAGLQRSILTVA